MTIWHPDPWPDYARLCAFGGRLAGSAGEAAAAAFVEQRLTELGATVRRQVVPFRGWDVREFELEKLDAEAQPLAARPLLWSPATPVDGLELEVVDLGRGAQRDFLARAGTVNGCAVLVRHEYMFAGDSIRRRLKYGWATKHGAAALLVANDIEGVGPISGSAGAGAHVTIPAIGLSHESGHALSDPRAPARIRLLLRTEEREQMSHNIIAEFPGRTDDWVVLSAHLDGHDLAESAIDNATGVATVLAVTRQLAPVIRAMRRSLRVCLFTFEEWDLTGSRHYVDALKGTERAKIACNMNLDSVAGGTCFAAMTSDFRSLPAVLGGWAAEIDTPLRIHEPLGANSDHYSFAIRGIPAFRIISGFDEPRSNLRYVLTTQDRLDKATRRGLMAAGRLTTHLCTRLLEGNHADLRG